MKKLQFYMTRRFQTTIDPLIVINLVLLVNSLFEAWPYDMFVFEPDANNELQVRLAGYHFRTHHLDESTIVARTTVKSELCFWLKIDDQADCYISTFLFPDEY